MSEVSVGYAGVLGRGELGLDEADYTDAELRFPGLSEVDPLSSPSLARLEVTPEDVESVKVTAVSLETAAGGCELPFSRVVIELVAAELGPVTVAEGEGEGEGCLNWTLAEQTELAPWFRQPTVSVQARVDGSTFESDSLDLRASFLVDIRDKPVR